jgi:hypothetical protein
LCARPITDARPVDRQGFPSATNQDRLCRFRQFRAGLDVTDNDSSTANPTRLTIRGRPGREWMRPNGRTVVSAWIWRRYCRYPRGRSLTPWASFPWNTFLTDCRSSSPPRVGTLYTRALAVCEKILAGAGCTRRSQARCVVNLTAEGPIAVCCRPSIARPRHPCDHGPA